MTKQSNATTVIGSPAPVTVQRPVHHASPSEPTIVLSAAPARAALGPAPARAAEPDIFLGQELCGYTIRRRLAEGGMGVVYEGIHRKIGRTGAIKVLKLELCRSEDVVERFYQEARAVNSIRHENIVDIYDFGRDPYGRVFFVMEYLEGESLAARIRRGAVTWSEAFPILDQTLRALKAAHDKGFVHRDLKPDNLWIRWVEGRLQVKLLDFGIAKLIGDDSPRDKLTQTGSVIGTPHYMSPEQINGSRDIDHRTDLYALGVIMYEMFAGVTPFVGDTLQAIMTGHLFTLPPRLGDVPANLGVPAPLAEVIDRMLVKDARDRYASAAAVLSDLHDLSRNQWPANAGALARVRPTRALEPMTRRVDRPRRRGRRVVVLASAFGGIATAAVAWWGAQREPEFAGVPTAVVDRARPAIAQPTRPLHPPGPPGPPEPPEPIDYESQRARAQRTVRAGLREPVPEFRVQSADLLGAIQDQPSLAALTEMTERDPDAEARGHTAAALAALGARDASPLLARLETGAPAPLKVWYASALARLGDASAVNRLFGYARARDLAVSFKAALALAELTRIDQPGDRKAIAALRALLAHESELNEHMPYASVQIAAKLVALHDPAARKYLHALLDGDQEGLQIAAAEGLAKLGDDAGRTLLRSVVENPRSPNRAVAAAAQIALGEYGGIDILTDELRDRDPALRRLAARALGEIGEPSSLGALIALGGDADGTVRIAAAGAILAVVGLDPQVLAQASVDWTRSALGSQELAIRRAAAGVLGDISARDAMPLLARAIADGDARVRLAAARSAGKIRTADAAQRLADAVRTELDPGVKEQQVVALGAIGAVGSAAAHDTLAQISEQPGRIGVLAAGALIAVGDASGGAKLEAAARAPQVELRLAAAQAASAATDPIAVPTLAIGIADRVFEVRFAAALGLAARSVERRAVVPILTGALGARDPGIVGRALAALIRINEPIANPALSPAGLLDSPDPRQRLAAVAVVRALPVDQRVPLIRRLLADLDLEVRRAGVDAIADLVDSDRPEAIRLYTPLTGDTDPIVRSKASGQLSRLAPPLPTAPVPATSASRSPAAVPDGVVRGFAAAQAAADAAAAQIAATWADLADLAAITAATARGDATTDHVRQLKAGFDTAPAQLATAADAVAAAARAVSDAAGGSPSGETAALVREAGALATRTRDAATAARSKAAEGARSADDFIKLETDDPHILVVAASFEVRRANFAEARRSLDKAARLLRSSGEHIAALDDLYSQVYLALAQAAQDATARRRLLHQAASACDRVIATGVGQAVQDAKDRRAEIADALGSLRSP
jgi:serine/threonine-protein kinase